MKRSFSILALITITLCVVMPLFAFALNETTTSTNILAYDGDDNINITVMMPEAASDSIPALTPEQATKKPSLYPSEVQELFSESDRQIVKTYTLSNDENPENISRDSFKRDGWLYELTDVTRKETASTSTQDHVQTVTINTDSRDMDAILSQLTPSIEYISEDGYIGILELDFSSISVQTPAADAKATVVSYVTTAEYKGMISKIQPDSIVYTAYFTGKQIDQSQSKTLKDLLPVMICVSVLIAVCGGYYFARKRKMK